MKFAFNIWVIFVALSLSLVAAYYSIIGLTAIFAASVIPVIIMGSTLEIAKVTTAVWLHTFWKNTSILIKSYLITAIAILMIITSMGIFGFLSKAHITQSANGINITAQVKRLDDTIIQLNNSIDRANNKLTQLTQNNILQDTGLQDKIQDQQNIITQIENRLNIAVNIQLDIISQETNQSMTLVEELAILKSIQTNLNTAISTNNVKLLQQIINEETDGVLGPRTRRTLKIFQNKLVSDIAELSRQITAINANDNEIVSQARTQIQNLQDAATADIKKANDAIDVLRNKLLSVTVIDNSDIIKSQENIILDANDKINVLYDKKFEFESELRQLAVEVGPVRYIAELVYGDTSTDLLEKAVRWVIILLVLVFDPLAIVLILAGVSSLKQPVDNKQKKHYTKYSQIVIPNRIIDSVGSTVESSTTDTIDSADDVTSVKNTSETIDENLSEINQEQTDVSQSPRRATTAGRARLVPHNKKKT